MNIYTNCMEQTHLETRMEQRQRLAALEKPSKVRKKGNIHKIFQWNIKTGQVSILFVLIIHLFKIRAFKKKSKCLLKCQNLPSLKRDLGVSEKLIRISFIVKIIGYWLKNLFYQKQECENDIIIKFVFGIWDFPLFLKQEK